ncbi:hypothetical protein FSP39_016296 [Pinctada imbricata]|uniref:non-specific serine/threonine protein kinase n=1 Tax=Pinctada imbricata TaxID=66713 RepID=A0AA88XWX1_PINIB|nr:hypothetical protein FSP39_016296 [Pinctada imbricata]
MATEVDSEVILPPNEAVQETSYLYVKVLGRGAFGEAVLYRKTDDNSLVVWKEVNLARLGEKETRDALGEVDILSLLDHPNIITYYNHFLDNQTLLIELEYANGGTLYHKISSQSETGQLFHEELVVWYLFQLVSAVAHIHQYGIIHRDIKTMNIFLTKSDLLKIGDFGISKVLESNSQMADTVYNLPLQLIGTPYYMSPELVKGDKYNYKTDVWAVGCTLFELLTLERTFQATNQLRLAYEIVKGDAGEISSQYSSDIRDLVGQLLRKDPDDRPEAEEILKNKIFSDDDRGSGMEKKVWELNAAVRKLRLQSSHSMDYIPVVKSKMSEVYQWGGGKVTPQKQEIFVKGKSAIQVAAGCGHFAVVTMEKELYTWANLQGGTQLVGQLGHGNNSAYKAPKLVEKFEGKGIIQVSCGEDFTVCVTDENKVYSFGSDYYGCLGVDGEHGDSVTEPILVDYFTSIDIQEISCGDNHVAALSKEGHVFTWGCGEYGRLGLGSEDDFSSPQKVKTPGKHLIKHVVSGCDGTFLITANGRVLAAGSNEDNKLGFNSETSGLRKGRVKVYDIPCKYTFTAVKPLTRHCIVTVAAGKTHSAVINAYGHLYTFGSNKYGQLGLSDFRRKHGINRVAGVLSGKRIENVACGDGFTVASTNDARYWTGGVMNVGGEWVWDHTSLPFTFTFWITDQPHNNPDENYMMLNRNLKWQSQPADMMAYPLCEETMQL